MAERQEMTIIGAVEMRMLASNRNDKPVLPLTETDRTLRSHSLQVLRRTGSGNPEVVALAETDGTPKVVNYGKDASGNIDPLRTNSDQQLENNLIGSDEAGNYDSVRTDPSRILWTRPYEAWVEQVGVLVPNSEGVLYNPGTTTAEVYWIQYKIVNIDAGAAAVTVSVGVDHAAGGGLATIEYDMFNEVIPYPGTSGWRDMGFIAGDDDVRGIASAADDAIIRFKIRRVDTGA